MKRRKSFANCLRNSVEIKSYHSKNQIWFLAKEISTVQLCLSVKRRDREKTSSNVRLSADQDSSWISCLARSAGNAKTCISQTSSNAVRPKTATQAKKKSRPTNPILRDRLKSLIQKLSRHLVGFP